MTAEIFSAVVRPATGFSTEKKKCGSTIIDSTAHAALAGLSAGTSTVADALDILSACVARGRAVTSDSIGLAQSVDS